MLFFAREVTSEEEGMRLDRWVRLHCPALPFAKIQKLLRKGQIRLEGVRARGAERLCAGQKIRLPPQIQEAIEAAARATLLSGNANHLRTEERAFLRAMTLYEDAAVLALNKPFGLPVQGGRGLSRHLDGLLRLCAERPDRVPRLTHRLDRETSGVLILGKTRRAAQHLTQSFRTRQTRKIYWALVRGVPSPPQGKISWSLTPASCTEGALMQVAPAGDCTALPALTHYTCRASAPWEKEELSWVTLKPVTGRTHQLRVHMAEKGHTILGDSKYATPEKMGVPPGFQNRLHLLARRIVLPHPEGGILDITAPLPPHMLQSWHLLGFDSGCSEN